ncbi:ABC transporter ATP-binding protein [Fodinicola feengrottensis]|uniref:ABC transporter ATP-binding protein n=1 Tax=Fodinicola feengrottensis TaxID=435914 RepID=A0ABP4UU03_9ACTN
MKIEADAVGVRTKRGTALAPVSLTLGDGDLVALTGPAGSGHTVLSLVLAGRLRPTQGQVRLDGSTDQRELAKAVRIVSDAAPFGPDGALPFSVTVAEALQLSGLPANRAAVRGWLVGSGLSDYRNARTDAVPAGQRTALLTRIAAQCPGVKAVVIDAPNGLGKGADAEQCWAALRDITEAGTAIAVHCHDGDAGRLPLAPDSYISLVTADVSAPVEAEGQA